MELELTLYSSARVLDNGPQYDDYLLLLSMCLKEVALHLYVLISTHLSAMISNAHVAATITTSGIK